MRPFALTVALVAIMLPSFGRAAIYSGPGVSTYQGPTGGPGGYATFDLDGDGIPDISLQAFSGGFRGPLASATVAAPAGSTLLFTTFPLDMGTRVDASQIFDRISITTLTPVPLPPGDLWGFRFTSGGATHYGWASVGVTAGGGGDFPPGFASAGVGTWAYESNPNTAIVVGAVPEPASASVLLVTASTLCVRRRR